MSQAVAEATVVHLSAEVLNAESLRIVQPYLRQRNAPVLHLDLGGLRLPTAEGLGALLFLNKELRSRGGALVLINVPTRTYEVLTLTRLVEVLDVRVEGNAPSSLPASYFAPA